MFIEKISGLLFVYGGKFWVIICIGSLKNKRDQIKMLKIIFNYDCSDLFCLFLVIIEIY